MLTAQLKRRWSTKRSTLKELCYSAASAEGLAVMSILVSTIINRVVQIIWWEIEKRYPYQIKSSGP